MQKKTVLIIEDNEQIRNLYTDAFMLADFNVEAVKSGEEGLLKALELKPDVLLVDIQLPGITGYEAVNKLRKDEWGKTAKVIFLTNFSDPDNVVHAIEQNPEEYIVKANTDIKDIVNKVRAAAF